MKAIRSFLFSVSFFSLMLPLNAQLGDIGTLVAGGPKDAELLLQNYLKPFGNALGANLSAGWYSTAKSHNLLGFDITLSTSVAFVPQADRMFDASRLALTNSGNISAQVTGTSSPTFSGKRVAGQEITYVYTYNSTPYEIAKYKTPQGTGLTFLPSPMLKIGIGLIKGTEIMGRYVPKVGLGKFGDFGLWGVGIKHELKQYIPVLSRVPILNISLMGGYTQMKSGANISFTPDDLGVTVSNQPSPDTWKNQRMDLSVSNWTVNLLVSADLPIIAFYGGAGVSSSKTALKLKGNYPIPTLNTTTAKVEVQPMANPIDISIEGKDGGITKPRLNAGFKLKLGLLHINFDYIYANYSVATAGFGISFR